MKSSYKIATIFGIPVKIHISLILLFPLMIMIFTGERTAMETGFRFNAYAYTAFLMLGIFISVALHELGHSLVGIKCGYQIKEIVLLPIGGVAKIVRMTSRPLHEILVAIAGPVVSLLLAITGIFAGIYMSSFSPALGFFIMNVGVINLVLAIFNLLPSFPMDGGRVLRAALTPRLGALEATRRAANIGKILAVLFGVYGLLWGHFWNLLIAIFIYNAAGAEYKMMAMREKYSKRFEWQEFPKIEIHEDPRVYDDSKISVGPPPYEKENE